MADQAEEFLVLSGLGYTQIEPHGQGAFGTVFSCDHPDGRRVAAKICFNRSNRDILDRETTIMRAIPLHQNIMQVIGAAHTKECSVLVMPLACGGDTLALMRERHNGPMTEQHARILFAQLLRGLAVMHQAGFVHRDIKCENLLLADTTRHHLIIADFGFACAFRAGYRTLTEHWGSLHYSSPEICAKIPYMGPEVDVWSAGVVLYAWVTGRLPFGGNSEIEIGARVVQACYAEPAHTSPQLNALFRAIFTPAGSDRITIAGIQGHSWMLAIPEPPRPFMYVRPRSISVVNVEFSSQEAGVATNHNVPAPSTTHARASAAPVAPATPSPRIAAAQLASPKRSRVYDGVDETEEKKASGALGRVAQFLKANFMPQRAHSTSSVASTSSDSTTTPPAAFRLVEPLVIPPINEEMKEAPQATEAGSSAVVKQHV